MHRDISTYSSEEPTPPPSSPQNRWAAMGLAAVCVLLLLVCSLESCGAKKLPDTFPVTQTDPFAANMIRIEGGTFTMGCLEGRDTDCFLNEKPAHQVTISTFSISKYEVTQAQWRAVMGSDPSQNSGCDNCPVEQVSWDDIQDFLRKLNAQTGQNYRLPTEAEWEYAARGGQRGKANKYLYSGGNTIGEVAWYNGNYKQGNTHGSQKTTRPVGGTKANELGLYDMSGNVWEWCADDWHSDYTNAPKDGSAWLNSFGASNRVYRGGDWYSYPRYCRVAARFFNWPVYSFNGLGFRLAL